MKTWHAEYGVSSDGYEINDVSRQSNRRNTPNVCPRDVPFDI